MANFDSEAWRAVLRRAAEAGASDIHIAAGGPIFFRVSGEMRPAGGEAPTDEEIAAILGAWLTPEQAAHFRRRRELDFARTEEDIRIRVNAFCARGGTALAVRLVPARIPSLAELGVPEIFGRLLELRHGLVLVTGSTGSGKTTTLAAFLDAVNQVRATHIITLEDPIEYVHVSKKSLVSQRELGTHFSSFGRALRSALREDPDILLVGELRDADTVATALGAAETGHLVLASLHTQSAAETVLRLESFFPAERQAQVRAQLSIVTEAIISQELLPGAEGGRVLAAEALAATPAVRHLIHTGKPQQLVSCIMSGSAFGMQSKRQAVERLAAQKKISKETARRYSELGA